MLDIEDGFRTLISITADLLRMWTEAVIFCNYPFTLLENNLMVEESASAYNQLRVELNIFYMSIPVCLDR